MPTILIPGALRSFTASNADVAVDATTVRSALAALNGKHPGIGAKLLDGDRVKPFIRIYVGASDIGELAGLDTPVSATDEISIIPAIAGGL
ncbi:MAG TPA: MoaD/ThiS family protein [Kofleriaceae bacterium]|jgi:molybdopterin converting factor small subunit